VIFDKDQECTLIPKIDGQFHSFYFKLLADVKDQSGREVGYSMVALLPGVYTEINAAGAFAEVR